MEALEHSGWLTRDEHGEPIRPANVPPSLHAPPCSTCGREIRRLDEALVEWPEPAAGEPFDGPRLVHIGPCDHRERCRDSFHASLELHGTVGDPYLLVYVLFRLLRLTQKHPPLSPEAARATSRVFGWLVGLAVAAGAEIPEKVWQHWPEAVEEEIENQWRSYRLAETNGSGGWHAYAMDDPIDYWKGWQCWDDPENAPPPASDASPDPDEWGEKTLVEMYEAARPRFRALGWEGDGVWRFSGFLAGSFGGPEFLLAVKQFNNGTTFVLSPTPLPWLPRAVWS